MKRTGGTALKDRFGSAVLELSPLPPAARQRLGARVDGDSDGHEDRRNPRAPLETRRPAQWHARSSGDVLGARVRITKTRSSCRVIPISSILRAELEAQRARIGNAGPDELVFQNAERYTARRKEPVQPGVGAGVRSDREAANLVAFVPARSRYASRRRWRISENSPGVARALGSGDHVQHVHTRHSRLAKTAVERVAGELFGVMDSVGLNSASAATPGGRLN